MPFWEETQHDFSGSVVEAAPPHYPMLRMSEPLCLNISGISQVYV